MANYSISYIYQIKDKMSPTIKKISSEVKRQTEQFKKQTVSMTRLVTQEEKFRRSLQKTVMETKKLNASLKFSANEVMNIGARLMALSFPIKKAMDFEKAMAGVAKASGLTRGTEEYEEVQNAILDMTKVLPQSANDIAAMFESGAKLGMAGDELKEFTMLAAKTGVAFDITAEEAGDALASIKAKMGLNIEEVGNMMDAVNQLGNTTAAKTNEMIQILGRFSGTAKAVNLMPEDAAGLAAFANQLAVTPQLAASGLNQMIGKMQQIPQLNKKLLEDPKKAIGDVLTSISKLDKEQQTVQITKIFGVEAGRFVQSAVNSMDLYAQTMGEVSEKQKFLGSMQKEFDTVMGTTSNQLDLAKNAFMGVAISIGLSLLPAVQVIIEAVTFFLDILLKFIDMTGPLVPTLFGITAAIYAFAAAQKIAAITSGIFTVGLNAARTMMLGARAAMLAFNVVMMANPIGLVVGAIALLVTALATMTDVFDPVIEKAKALWGYLSSFLGLSDEPIDIDVNSNMQAGDTNATAELQGRVDVGVTANNATVDSVETRGANVSGRAQVGYGDAMTAG